MTAHACLQPQQMLALRLLVTLQAAEPEAVLRLLLLAREHAVEPAVAACLKHLLGQVCCACCSRTTLSKSDALYVVR